MILTEEHDAWKQELKFFHQNGGRTMVDVTNHGIGRDVKVLKELSQATDVNLIAGTGENE